ncbi:MAG: serine/threonine protein kinase, partial [Anaerolineae bacterium]|nr:serine/threonine protein kinase [Anaerolineae bacterium]
GDDLASIVRQSGLISVQQAIIWISQVADALEYLHSRDPAVVHRDIKPGNIRITPEGKAMLVDFGLVKVYNPQLKTTMGARAVTPGYAPPEQYGQGSTDARSDIYALGATLFAILTGQEPLESVQRMSGVQMSPAHQFNPSVPPAMSGVIERSLRLEPSQRYQHVNEFKTALRSISSPVLVKPVNQAYAVPAMRAPAMEPSLRPPISGPKSQPKSQPRGKTGTGLYIGIGALVLVCILGGVGIMGLIIASQKDTARATSDAQLQATLAERVKTTSTAQSKGTATARAQATQQSLLARLEANSRLVYGPHSGSLEHDAGTAVIAQDADVNLRDFIVEARFFNPYAASEGQFDYGFIVRHETKNVQFRFVIQSGKTWLLLNNTGEPDGETIAQGKLPTLKVGAGDTNLVKLVFQGNRGWFFLNNELISEMDLSARMNSGVIYIASGIFQDAKIAGKTTRFTEFRIWALP